MAGSRTKSRLLSLGLTALLVLALACSGAAQDSDNTPPVGAPNPSEQESHASDFEAEKVRVDLRPLIEGPVSADGLQAIFATSDLGLGENRIGFVLTTGRGIVRLPTATVSSFYAGSDASAISEPHETALATFRDWPYGTRGLYTTAMNFDKAGRWRLNITVFDIDAGTNQRAELAFDVFDHPETLAVGDAAFKSMTKTLGDVEGIEQLTTGTLQDPELYQISLADAVENDMPTVVTMASPAFCANAVCGPQVDVLKELKDAYKGQANFVHVDFYDNPHEIQGDLSRAVLSPTVVEWNLPSIEWTFVIDRQGTVTARFESFATFEEVEEALQREL